MAANPWLSRDCQSNSDKWVAVDGTECNPVVLDLTIQKLNSVAIPE